MRRDCPYHAYRRPAPAFFLIIGVLIYGNALLSSLTTHGGGHVIEVVANKCGIRDEAPGPSLEAGVLVKGDPYSFWHLERTQNVIAYGELIDVIFSQAQFLASTLIVCVLIDGSLQGGLTTGL